MGKFDNLVAQQVRLDTRNTHAIYIYPLIECFDEFHERVFVTLVAKFALTIIAHIYAGEHNFWNVLFCNLLRS